METGTPNAPNVTVAAEQEFPALLALCERQRAQLDAQLQQLDAQAQQLNAQRQQLDAQAQQLNAQRQQLDAQAQQLDAQAQQVARLERMLFGRRSERVEPARKEVERELRQEEVEAVARRLAEEEKRAEPNEQDQSRARRIVGRKKSESERAAKRKSRLETLPIIEERIAVTPEDLPAGMTLGDFKPLGSSDIVTRVTHVRGHLLLKRYELPKMQHKEQSSLIVRGSPPDTVPLEGGRYEASVYSAAVIARVLENMPLHRLARSWSRDGYPTAPSVLIGLFHHAAFLLTPIYDRLVKELQQAPYVCADETPQPMLEPGRGKTARAWMWMGLCDTVIAYYFDTSRSAAAGERLLGTGLKNLMVDGYSGYSDAVIEGGRAACWSHARRGVYELRENWAVGQEILRLIREIYRVEVTARLRDPRDEVLLDSRKSQSAPRVDALFAAVRAELLVLSPASTHAKVLQYFVNREPELRRFLSDVKIPLDNNISERALRTVALGRRNSLFVGPGGNGQDLAILLTVLRTCELHRVNPADYLDDVLLRLRRLGWRKDKPDDARSELDELTPARWKAARLSALAD